MKIEVPGTGWRMDNNLCKESVPAMGFSSAIGRGVVQVIGRKKPVNGGGGKIAESKDKQGCEGALSELWWMRNGAYFAWPRGEKALFPDPGGKRLF